MSSISSRTRALKDSTNGFCHGAPGSMNAVPVPDSRHQSRRAVSGQLTLELTQPLNVIRLQSSVLTLTPGIRVLGDLQRLRDLGDRLARQQPVGFRQLGDRLTFRFCSSASRTR